MYFDRRVITKTLYLLSRPLVQEAMVGRNHAGGVRPPRYNVDEARGERVYRYMVSFSSAPAFNISSPLYLRLPETFPPNPHQLNPNTPINPLPNEQLANPSPYPTRQ